VTSDGAARLLLLLLLLAVVRLSGVAWWVGVAGGHGRTTWTTLEDHSGGLNWRPSSRRAVARLTDRGAKVCQREKRPHETSTTTTTTTTNSSSSSMPTHRYFVKPLIDQCYRS